MAKNKTLVVESVSVALMEHLETDFISLTDMVRASLEKTGSQLDNLLLAEKLAWIESTQNWVELRELRNRLVHEYMESADDLLDALHQALDGVQVLTATQLRMAAYARKSLLP